ncbi:EAL domain-containing protein (putative c-di-GMP-specific phosphodiesterase class I) [Bacillus tianshenii]|uniref:EAL domain-containing protein (Putative c-di-GMP-specific phosphodiesterase class I) n=1 Tax=Sutcliffiella tianshenii TaxID=1463404 RepID=A0ABS2NYU5_9BACI|nr:EAL domain-containing protein [Bacillus tianshenii]MBM7619859.1 EAL domain-containing protein (putative c-di-GMP-specific phosphodiesterase class I) [Bacillus tianshenii]
MHCIDCGVPSPIEESGTLIVKQAGENGQYPYSSYKELADHILMLQKEGASEQPQVKTDSMNGFISLSAFELMVQNHELVDLIAGNSFSTHFQPIIDLQDENRIFAYECLLRPVAAGKPISPFRLFEFARETNLHNYLDQKARELSIISSSRLGVPPEVKFFINFLPSSIYNPEYCLQHTFHIVNKHKISPDQLVFEVVESEKISDIEHLESIFTTYKKSGMQVALDDVGAGYSTLDVLQKLQPDFVKVDRSYVSFCDTNYGNQLFLKNVLEISKKLGIKVLAEGIERAEELEFCRTIGIDYAQGYFIGKPSAEPVVPQLETV